MLSRLVLLAALLLTAVACSASSSGGAATGGRGGAAGGASTPTGGGGATGGSATSTGGTPSQGGAGGAGAPQATVLGFLPLAVNDDGSVVVGREFPDSSRPVRWTDATGAVPITGFRSFIVRAISGDGQTIMGHAEDNRGVGHIALIAEGKQVLLSSPRAGDIDSTFVAARRDARAIAGNGRGADPGFPGTQAFHWTAEEGVELVPPLPGDASNEAFAMSPDGNIIVGLSYGATPAMVRPFRWTRAAGTVELPSLPGRSLNLPVAVNDAGAVVADSFTGGEVTISVVSGATARSPIVWVEDVPRALTGCASMFAPLAIGPSGTILSRCPPATLLLTSASGALIRRLSLPEPPLGYSATNQSLLPVSYSPDANVVVGLYSLDSLGGTASMLAVWTGDGALPSLVSQKLDATPGNVELRNPQAMALSADGSTVVGLADGPAGWLLRLR